MFQSTTKKIKEEYSKLLDDLNLNIDEATHRSYKMVKEGKLRVKLNGTENSIAKVEFKDKESSEICICAKCNNQRELGEKPLHSQS